MSLSRMLCYLKLLKHSRRFLTILCNKANPLAMHYSWDGRNLLIVSCWLSNTQRAGARAPRANSSLPQAAELQPCAQQSADQRATSLCRTFPLKLQVLESITALSAKLSEKKNAFKDSYAWKSLCCCIWQSSARKGFLESWWKAAAQLWKPGSMKAELSRSLQEK